MCAFLNDKNIIAFTAVAANLPLSSMRIILTNYNGNENENENASDYETNYSRS